MEPPSRHPYLAYRRARKALVDGAALVTALPWIAARAGRHPAAVPQEPRSVLILALLKIGDTITSLPTIRALRERYPRSRLRTWVRPELAPLLRMEPDLGELVWGPLPKTLRKMRREPADLAVVLSFRPEHLWWARLSGARAVAAYDYKGRGRMADLRAAPPYHIGFPVWDYRPGQRVLHQVEIVHRLAEALGVEAPPAVPALRGIPASGRFPSLPSPRILLHPWNDQAHYRWETRRWSELADRLARQYGGTVFLSGSPAEKAHCETIAAACKTSPRILAGTLNLIELAGAMGEMDLVVTIDTMTSHLTAALGKPVVALFGPGSPAVWRPYGPGHAAVQNAGVCHGCRQVRCFQPRHYCMEELTVDAVMEAVSRTMPRTVP